MAGPQLPVDCDVVVVGGGITGTASAYYLSVAGASVALVEERDLNTQASGRNAGSLHGQIQFEPFHTRGPEWATDFLPALRFLADSVALWRELTEELGQDLEVSLNGGLLVADTDEQAELIGRKVALENAGGFATEMISGADLRRLAPYLSPSIIAAEFSPNEGKTNPLLAGPALARAAARNGAQICLATATRSIQPTSNGFRVATAHGDIHCGRVVVASGGRLAELTLPFGIPALVSDEPVQVHATEPVEPIVPHLVYYAGGRLTLKQAKAGTLLIGGGWPAQVDPDSGHPTVSSRSMRGNLRIAAQVVPWIASVNVIRAWPGVGNATPDLLPLIAQSPSHPGFFAGMFPHMGLTAGPLMGRVLADLALGRDPGLDLVPFGADRFTRPADPVTPS